MSFSEPYPIAAMWGNSFGSAFVPPMISVRLLIAHNDTFTGVRSADKIGGITVAYTDFAYSAHSEINNNTDQFLFVINVITDGL